jgi:hypothetical protein
MHDVGADNKPQQQQQVSNASQQNQIHQNPMQQQLLTGEGETS